jgi:hypothetical protein
MTGRGQREGVAAEFLRDVLAGRALGVPKLEAMARTAGLLGEGQRITHAKVFKKAKKSLRRPAHHPCEDVQKSQKVPWHKIRSERIWGRR